MSGSHISGLVTVALILFLGDAGRLIAQVDKPVPPGGEAIFANASREAVISSTATAYGSVTLPTPEYPAFRFTVEKMPRNPWDIQARWINPAPIKKGEILLLTARARTLDMKSETGESRITTSANRATPPHDSWGGYEFAVGSDWTVIAHPFQAKTEIDANGFQFGINFGTGLQTVELADVSILRFPAGTPMDQMPRPIVTYEGREQDAAWRKEAQERIEKIRKGDLSVTVRDLSGNPIPGAQVHVAMRRHAFPFGTSVRAFRLLDDSPEHEQYRSILTRYFNRATFENEMKWRKTGEPQNSPDKIERAVDWLLSQGFSIRGHCLIWPAARFLPDDVVQLRDKPEELRARFLDHIANTVEAYRGRVSLWDVLNEPVNNMEPWVKDALGPNAMTEWFEAARAAAPEAHLYLNDYAMLSGGARDARRIDELENILRTLKNNDAPVDGIGEQAHFDATLVAPEKMLKTLDRFAAFGLPIEITEFDIASSDARLRADYTRDFLIAAFSHPSVAGITIWGFWAGSHWKPEAALWNRDWSIRPNGQAFIDLVRQQWWTDVTETTDASGNVRVRGFLGEYEITVNIGDRQRKVIAQLPGTGLALPVRIDVSSKKANP